MHIEQSKKIQATRTTDDDDDKMSLNIYFNFSREWMENVTLKLYTTLDGQKYAITKHPANECIRMHEFLYLCGCEHMLQMQRVIDGERRMM